MAKIETTLEDLAQGQSRAAQERHTFVVERNHANVIELDDLQYHVGSTIFSPVPVGAAPVPEHRSISGLSVIAQLLEQHDNRPLLVAAHADDSGVSPLDLHLSQKRADNVLAYLQGDADAFAEASSQLDFKPLQTLLAWAATTHEHGCDPGPIDGENNEATRSALERFREHHNEKFEVEFAPDPEPTADDFRAFFTLYDLSLAELMSCEVADLKSKRSALTFHKPSTLAAGDRFELPGGRNAEELRSTSKRRVDLILFEPGVTIPKLDRNGALIYDDDLRVLKTYLPPELPPAVSCVRLLGMFFDTNKNFLLPIALRGLRQVVDVYEEHPNAELLIVGHTDRSGQPDYNDVLSLARARSMLAYLTEDVDAWLARYEDGVPAQKRWGATEDEHMLETMPDIDQRPIDEDIVRWFQRTRGLEVDGIAGPDTRRALIGEYMAIDGTSLPKTITAKVHGCGENFPTGNTQDGEHVQQDRRVELFFFDAGIEPPPPGGNSKPGSAEYPKWRARTTELIDISERGNIAFDFAFERDAEAGVIRLQFSIPGQIAGPLTVRIAELDNAIALRDREVAVRAAAEAAAAAPGFLKGGRYHRVQDGEALAQIALRYGHQDVQAVFDHFANTELREERKTPAGVHTDDLVYIPMHPADHALAMGALLPTRELERAEGGARRLEAEWNIAETGYDLLDPTRWRQGVHLGVCPLLARDQEIEDPSAILVAPQIVVLDEKFLSLGVSPTPFEIVKTVEYQAPEHTSRLLVMLEGGLFREVPAKDGSEQFRREERPTSLFGAIVEEA
jgi:outer membrane protein OmpA-like peptidoglycan-associated protein